MTTVLYDGKNLHADRRIVSAGFPSIISDTGTKLFRSPCNRFALGIGNILPNEDELKEYFKFAFHLLANRHKNAFVDRGSLKSVRVDDFKFEDPDSLGFIAMSDTHAVHVHAGQYHPQTNAATFLGTGGRFAYAAYWVTRDPAAAMKTAAKLDYLTSPVFDTIPANTLSPFTLG